MGTQLQVWIPTHMHYKGGIYKLIAPCVIEATMTPAFVYEDSQGMWWVRSQAEWDEEITMPSGRVVKRFEPLPNTEPHP